MSRQAKIHLVLAAFWALLIVPTLVWWKDSVLWVALLSISALVIGHISSYEAAQSGVAKSTFNQVRAIAEGLSDFMTHYANHLPEGEGADLLEDAKELRATLGIEEGTDG